MGSVACLSGMRHQLCLSNFGILQHIRVIRACVRVYVSLTREKARASGSGFTASGFRCVEGLKVKVFTGHPAHTPS